MRNFLYLLLVVQLCYSIDLESAKEFACVDVNNTVAIDTKWMASVKTWYIPAMSRYDLYNFIIEMTGLDPADISENDLYYDSCLYSTIEGGTMFVNKAFGGKYTYNLEAFPKDPEMQVATFRSVTDKKFSGTLYATMTDNKSFVFFTACFARTNQMVWGAMSSEKSLPKATIDKIHEHALAQGFSKSQFTGLRYDSCDLDVGNSGDRNEL